MATTSSLWCVSHELSIVSDMFPHINVFLIYGILQCMTRLHIELLLEDDSRVCTTNDALGMRCIWLVLSLDDFPFLILLAKCVYYFLPPCLSHSGVHSSLDITLNGRLQIKKIINSRGSIINTLTSHIRYVIFARMQEIICIKLQSKGLVSFMYHTIEPHPTSFFKHGN